MADADPQAAHAVDAQAARVKQLKSEKAADDVIAAEVAKLLQLKRAAGMSTTGKGDKEDHKFMLKCAKGTKDYGPEQMSVRNQVIELVTETFRRHGAESIDTPVFELRDTLMGKYGEEGGKLVYDLEDQGGERLSLRYDLTVPFARYCAMNRVKALKRYHIAKVYRRDQPRMTRGRYREFYQCDFDIAGTYDAMLPEVECLRIVDEILSQLQLGAYEIKVNHRLLLDGLFAYAGIKASKFKAVCSSIDKLDKRGWTDVRDEIVNEKGVKAECVDRLEALVRVRQLDPALTCATAIDRLAETLGKEKSARVAFEQLRTLLAYVDALGMSDRVKFEPSLARGLDYYTGVIYEAVIADYASSSEAVTGELDEDAESALGVGSVAAGGRYDKLVGQFMGKSAGGKDQDVPCCGVSIGIERLFAIMEEKQRAEGHTQRTTCTDVYVGSAHKGLTVERLKLARRLWEAGIRAEMPYKTNPKLLDQLQHCESAQIPLALIIGDNELQAGVVKVRTVKTRHEQDVPLDELVEHLRTRIEHWRRKDE